MASISIATNEQWKDKQGNKQEKTTWHRCILWDKMAEKLAEYLVKGKQVYVEGKIQTRKYTDKNQIERYVTEIRVSSVVLLGGGKSESAAHPEYAGAGAASEANDDDIPF